MSEREAKPTSSSRIERFVYDDDIVRKFLFVTALWGVVGMLVGVIVAIQLAMPQANLGLPWTTFGRLRPLHTNAVIFAFAGNAIFTAVYYSAQRVLKARMFSRALGLIHFWGWQAIIVSAAITLPLGITQGKEYAELEWPIDIAIALVWIVFAVNLFGTIAKRRERHLYVAIWFYIGTIIAITVLHVFNSLVVPSGLFKSYALYAGVQDAFMQWWYGHNAVAFFLTTPFLGLMYYFLPKAADRPVFSYKLSIIHFWSIVFIYIWAGPHHLHYTALPEWASTLGMLFSLMLWMPSWGGMLNGLLTLRGAWHRVAQDPILKFFVVGVTFYGMATFEGPLLSIKGVNALSHYTDWTIAHVHSGTLGWVAFMSFGMMYWLTPRLFQARMWVPKFVNTHFWLSTVGMLLYIVPIYAAGLAQGLMWRAFDEQGALAYPDFIETIVSIIPLYWLRVLGGTLFLTGAVLGFVNIIMTWTMRPESYEQSIGEAAPLTATFQDQGDPQSRLDGVTDFAHKLDVWLQAGWHRRWERLPLRFTIWVTIAVVVASLAEIVPTFVIKSNVKTIETVTPYSPLELLGRDIYIAEGCYNCHSQMVRPLHAETERFGEYSKGGEFVYDHPFQWGSRRIGPDLHRVGGRYSYNWHVLHLNDPTSTSSKSIMPPYPWLLEDQLDFESTQPAMRANQTLGTPYTDAEIADAPAHARAQATIIAAEVLDQDGPPDIEDKKIVALVAYLQRLGTDIFAKPDDEEGDAAELPAEAAAEVTE
jgi:cytochrome c oxidase cbb3-type subunit I/II